jgi:hypothetical protein
MTTLAMRELVRMPYVGTVSQHSLDREPWEDLEPALLVRVHERVIRAAGFVARGFLLDDTIAPVYGWQTHDRRKADVFWSCWLFGQQRPERNKHRYADLSAALCLEDWARPEEGRSKDRHCPLVVADLGPTEIAGKIRISPEHLKELALKWSASAPLLKEPNIRLEALFCEWDGRAYLLTVPLFLHDIAYRSVVQKAEDTIAAVCGAYLQTETDHVTLWHIGNMQNIDYVPRMQEA